MATNTKMNVVWTVEGKTQEEVRDSIERIVAHIWKLGITSVEVSANLSVADMELPKVPTDVPSVLDKTWQWTPTGS